MAGGTPGPRRGLGSSSGPPGGVVCLGPPAVAPRGPPPQQRGPLADRAKTFGVALSALLAGHDLPREQPELLKEDRGLDRVEPAIQADKLRFRLVGPPAVVTERAEPPRSVIVVGEHGPAIAVAAERLLWIED